jgi:uncharacterized membrane protein
LEQDPTFAFRILVDTSIKALPPAIKDPTIAVMGIDPPTWEDYVHLSCIEMRHCGARSIQIVLRIRSDIGDPDTNAASTSPCRVAPIT